MGKKKVIALLVAGIIILVLVFFFATPVQYPLPTDGKQARVAVIVHMGDIEITGQRGEPSWDLKSQVKSYDMNEDEAEDIKERIIVILQKLKCYRTPSTILHNIIGNTPMQFGKKAEDINIIFHSGEKTNTFMIQGNYIMVNGKYYSLGWKGEEKGIQFIDELESIMVDAEE